MKLNRKITDLNKKLANNSSNNNLQTQADDLTYQLQKELTDMAEKWQIRSKAKWIEQEEKSTKYFFARYKARKAHAALSEIKIPNTLIQDEDNTLQYIKDQYAKIYSQEEVNIENINEITENIKQVSDQQTISLTKTFSKEEIAKVIKGLPNNKSPGTNGLTYEFYKHYEEVVTPILQKVFNDTLFTSNMLISWTKSLIILIFKKSSDLNSINN